MKNIIICLIAFLAMTGFLSPAYSEEEPKIEVELVDMVAPSEDHLLSSVDKSDLLFTRLENTKLKIVSYFHKRMIGRAIVEKDFIRYQFDTETGELIEKKVRWRKGLPEKVTLVITQEEAESMVEGEAQFARLYFISPESDVFIIPCILSSNGRMSA